MLVGWAVAAGQGRAVGRCAVATSQRVAQPPAAPATHASTYPACLTTRACFPPLHPSPHLQVRPGEVAVLDCDAQGRTLVFNRSHANNIVAADIVYSSVAA